MVIAIIAILAAILFPLFTSAKESARTSSCESNLKQIYVGLMGYCDDYQGYMPDCQQMTGAYGMRQRMSDPPNPLLIHAKLYKYVGNKREIFKCPGDNMVPRMAGDHFDLTDPNITMCVYALYACSYQWRLIPTFAPNPINHQLISFYPRPTKLGIARDGVGFHRNQQRQVQANWNSNSSANLLFLDGHVKLTPGNALGGFDSETRF